MYNYTQMNLLNLTNILIDHLDIPKKYHHLNLDPNLYCVFIDTTHLQSIASIQNKYACIIIRPIHNTYSLHIVHTANQLNAAFIEDSLDMVVGGV